MQRLEAAAFQTDRLSRRSFRSLMRSPSATVIVATSGARFAGYAVVLLRKNGVTARLYSIAVDVGHAGQGVGSALLAAAEETARKKKAERLRLEVRADNPRAIRFYLAHGYREIGHRADYYADGMEARVFVRPLSAAPAATSRRLRRAA